MPSLQEALDVTTGSGLGEALAQRVSFGAFLKAFVSPVTETVNTSSGDTATLSKKPIHGTLIQVLSNGTPKAWRPSGTLAAGQFSLSGTAGTTLTLYSGEGHASTLVSYLTLEHAGDNSDEAAFSDSTLTADYPAT